MFNTLPVITQMCTSQALISKKKKKKKKKKSLRASNFDLMTLLTLLFLIRVCTSYTIISLSVFNDFCFSPCYR